MAEVMQSAVRLPSPEPGDDALRAKVRENSPPRNRSPVDHSSSHRRSPAPASRQPHSRSPPRRNVNGNGPLPRDVDRSRAMERARQLEMRQRDEAGPAKSLTDEQKQAAAKAEYDKLLNMRSGGTYIPPARLKALQAQITDKTSKEYQRMAWEALKKSINGMINKVSISNIKHIVPELFNENLVRGRGLFCRSIMKAQAVSLPYTPILAAMAAIVNTKLPQVGELLVNRLIIQFRKAFKRNDKSVCNSATTFLAHLINQQVAHEMLAAQILLLLLHKPTDDSVEIAVGLMKEVGHHIEEMNSQIALAVYDQFRSILHEANIDKRVQYMIEVLFQIRKDKYKDHQAVKEELDLVEEEDQITHRPGLDDQLSTEDGLNVFKFDADFEADEEAYRKLKAEILGEASGSEGEDEDAGDESDEEEDDEQEKALEIKDQSNTDLVNLRRSIYLTIMSSGGFEEACHKLMRINLPSGKEEELPSMIIECCSQERTYNKFFGLIGERFCKLNRLWKDLFEQMFAKYYDTIHRYETNRLRIIAQFFGHLLSSDGISWEMLQVIKLNEEDTTSSSRIFVKILMEDLAQGVGMKTLTEKLRSEELAPAMTGMFPTDNPKNTRFSINFFTAIGMGQLTEGLREWLKNMPKPAPVALPAKSPTTAGRERSESASSYSSYSSYSSRSRSDSRSLSRSRTPPRKAANDRSVARSRSPPRRTNGGQGSISQSRLPPRREAGALSREPRSAQVARRGRSDSYSDDSRSRSPPPAATRKRRYSSSMSPSPPPAKRAATGNARRSVSQSLSRSPPRRNDARGRSYTRSASPPKRSENAVRDRSRSPPRKRARSPSSSYDSRSRSRSPPPRARTNAARERSDSRSLSRSLTKSRSPPRRTAPSTSRVGTANGNGSTQSRGNDNTRGGGRDTVPPARKRRRNTSSPDTSRSRSRSPPARVSAKAPERKETAAVQEKSSGVGAEEDVSNIHPSRRGLMGGGRGGRAKASDFM
ncbi:pre-mRNA-splicing factor cwc22 [Friedmanniomyces endolithicus]|uniref:Pre-mRNA-splicing factor CWC22 n=1 Tax=Friedmanniomyces endolithicus TaxID=329885 RepID=A0AAN6KDC3_9PEZI|nr:pre-mRNA-splicing factor cwc22 [Friedmanniomyces endolithicus]KAK0963979.1 pre-mRNA-splicing factor cwc22 [Friedmanniomyces endolithicus]KAK0976867.1 pre-mRNA-splicing factor cwc22 [Friedmanniomyces endolithicus]KAK1028893.1 pre-mRNA-splicing factor cwc22 [Friedmanniomyces endolithicus]